MAWRYIYFKGRRNFDTREEADKFIETIGDQCRALRKVEYGDGIEFYVVEYEETEYAITEKQLNDIVKFAQEHPDTEFYTEPMNDGELFLSCTFFDDDNENASGFWELDEVKTNEN